MSQNHAGSKGSGWLHLGALSATLLLFGAGCAVFGKNSRGTVLTQHLSAPIDGVTSAKYNINAGTGNLTIDPLTGSQAELVSGELEYVDSQGLPGQAINSQNGQAVVMLKANGTGKGGFHWPWDACNGETNWRVHLNAGLPSDLVAHSDGGNISLNLAGTAIMQVAADTGGGNVDVVLPAQAGRINVSVKSGAGNVVVHVPAGTEARIHATTGMGKVLIDQAFSQADKTTYQSPGYDNATDKVDITLSSGAGNVSVTTN